MAARCCSADEKPDGSLGSQQGTRLRAILFQAMATNVG